MPIIQNSVKVTLKSNVIEYYEKKNYCIPRIKDCRGRLKVKEGTTIIVKVEDLMDGCGIPVYVSCDTCGKIYPLPWRDIHLHDGKIYCKNCSGFLRRGEKAYNWKSEKSQEERENERDYPEYHDFIRRVMYRDNYSCKICGSNSGINVHHLDGYNWCYEKRTKDNNGVTLCEKCHNAFHSIYGRGNNTKEQFEDWIGMPIGELSEGTFPPCKKVICMDDGIVYDSVPAVAKKYEFDRNLLYNVVNRKYRAVYKKHHFLWYDDYIKMEKDDVMDYWRWVIGVKNNPL